MMLPDPSPVLDKTRAPMGPEILSSTGAEVWRKAPMAFPDSSSVLDKFQSAIICGRNVHPAAKPLLGSQILYTPPPHPEVPFLGGGGCIKEGEGGE